MARSLRRLDLPGDFHEISKLQNFRTNFRFRFTLMRPCFLNRVLPMNRRGPTPLPDPLPSHRMGAERGSVFAAATIGTASMAHCAARVLVKGFAKFSTSKKLPEDLRFMIYD